MPIDSIYRKVLDTADRFGADNPQQLKQLNYFLEKYYEQDVSAGLLKIFMSHGTN